MSNTKCHLVTLVAVLLCTAMIAEATAPVRLRINTRHGLDNARGAVLDAGLKLNSEVSVTPSSDYDGRPFLPPDKFFVDGKEAGAAILSSSFSNWQFAYDSIWYQKLTESGMLHVYAYEPRRTQPPNVPPPAAFVTVNMIGGMSGDGIEFGIPTTYMQGRGKSSTASGVTAQLAGLMACLKYLHPDWNWFDVKAALRTTAANYSGGYNPQNYGYGSIDYHGANSLSDAAALPLFAPAAVVAARLENRIDFYINSFKQSRRVTDVLFKFPIHPGIHLKELKLVDIVLLGGQHLFSNYFSNSNVYSYQSALDETVFFVWFTMDANGRFSRLEPYSVIGPVRFRQLYRPRVNH